MRASEFVEHAPGEFGFSTLIIGMFLLGYWFVRTGVMEHPEQHLPLFRKLATVGLPIGVGLGIVGSLIATQQTPGMERDPYQTATALLMIGNLPACLGYMSMLVLMLHSRGPFSKVAVLAPLGRMALTNYLTQSFVIAFVLFGVGPGLALAGKIGTTALLAIVVVTYAAQLVFSRWWLGRFAYGPMEWVWRALTYGRMPSMRLSADSGVARE